MISVKIHLACTLLLEGRVSSLIHFTGGILMQRICALVMATIILAFGSIANAGALLDWTLDLSSLGGPVVSHINGIGMNGSVHLVQAASGPGSTVLVGDAFTLTSSSPPATPIDFKAVSYIDSALNTMLPLLMPGQGVLSVQSSAALTGFVNALLGGNMYSYLYSNPGAGALTLHYTDPASVNHVIADFTLLPTSGGISSDDFVSTTGMLTGTSNLYTVMHVDLPGVLFTSGGADLFTLPGIEMANMSGIFNYIIPIIANPLVADISSNNNATLGLTSIPEPATMLLLAAGVLALSFLTRGGRKE